MPGQMSPWRPLPSISLRRTHEFSPIHNRSRIPLLKLEKRRNSNKWSVEQPLCSGPVDDSSTGPVNQLLIGDNTAAEFIPSGSTNSLFETVQVYTVAGRNQHLTLIESIEAVGARCFCSYTATRLSRQ
ncbi:hypothetical protein GGR57DRAFT_472043 [Xylariaceae sp. FL1272]|nr:hypothetical protein GGR57DRAFT_472043 [Xylariaceae sp. FL1272]